jgi:hypothetical protein
MWAILSSAFDERDRNPNGLRPPDLAYAYATCAAPYFGTWCGSVGEMPTMRRSAPRVQKKVAETDENSPIVQPPSSHASMALMNACVRSAPASIWRDSITVLCMVRTTYQRGALVGSSGLKTDRRRTMR